MLLAYAEYNAIEGKKKEAAVKRVGSGGKIRCDKKVMGVHVASTMFQSENFDSGADLKINAIRPSGVS